MIILSAFLLLLALIYTSLLVFYRKWWKAIPDYHSSDLPKANIFITVIISARDEEQFLPALLNDLKQQNLSSQNFEVLVVDDHSTDATPEIVESAGRNIRLIKLSDHITTPMTAYKKKAIETAISLSHGNVIVTTDADCRVRQGWLKMIAEYFGSTTCQFLVMPVAILQPKNFFQTFQALDFMSLQGITGAALHGKWHYMCNGANLAYRKETFYKVKGFEGIDKIASGDDMLLMEKFAAHDKNSIHYLKSREVIVETAATLNIKTFIQQRARWAGKTAHYKSAITTSVLLLVYILNVSFVLLPLVAVLFRTRLTGSFELFLISWVTALFLKTISEVYFLKPVAHFFNRTLMMKKFPLAQPFHIVYTVFAGFLGMMGRQRWKGRRI